MNDAPALSQDPSTRIGPRLPIWARWLLASVGMLLSSLAVALPLAVPGLGAWADAEHSGLAILGQAMVVTAIYATPTGAALLLLWGVSRLDRVQLRHYLGRNGGGLLRFLGYMAAVALPTAGLSFVIRLLGVDAGRDTPEFSSNDPWLVILVLVVTAVLMQGIPEELWFRGMAWGSARHRPVLTLVGTTLVFAVLHLVSIGGQESTAERFSYLVLPLGMGLLAGCARWCTDSVWASAGTHSGLHIGMIPAYLLAYPTGPWLWVTLGALQAGAGAVLLLVHKPWRTPPR